MHMRRWNSPREFLELSRLARFSVIVTAVAVASRSPPPREVKPPSSNFLGELSAHAPIFASFLTVVCVAIGRIVPPLNPVSLIFQWLTPSSRTFTPFRFCQLSSRTLKPAQKSPTGLSLDLRLSNGALHPKNRPKEGKGAICTTKTKLLDEGVKWMSCLQEPCPTSGPAMWRLASPRIDNSHAVSVRNEPCDIRFAFPNRAAKIHILKTEPSVSKKSSKESSIYNKLALLMFHQPCSVTRSRVIANGTYRRESTGGDDDGPR